MSLVRIFDESENENEQTSWNLEDVKEYVKTYLTYELQIKDLQESRREWSSDFIKNKNLPKKELTQALSTAKKDLDMDVVNEIYDNIVGLFE
tara:strand:+ start:887 stop:1162 length:276 start_codon:yes stop_codon:yes gene_type:complete